MPDQASSDSRVLILLNPGRQSRHYLLGLAAGAVRAGIPCLTLELGPIWAQTAGSDAQAALGNIRRQIADLVRQRGITHAIGYVFNGVADLGIGRASDGTTKTLWDELGVRHLLLWTDHPEWATSGKCLDEPMRSMLAGPRRVHFLKSESAAAEAGHILQWPNTHALAMAEDYEAHRPAAGVEPQHDAVAIVGDAAAPPGPTLPFLELDDPDPSEIDALMRTHAEHAWNKVIGSEHDTLMHAWLELKQRSPEVSYWRLAAPLEPSHGGSLAWLRADPRRWYTAVQALRRMVGWRRNFWLAWLGRRVNLGLYGSPAAPMGIPQTPEASGWVGYEQQAAVYARGRVAININASHDEEGLTHKPFQIAAAGVACLHHAGAELDRCFTPGREILTFRRGPELLDAVRALGSNQPHREALAQAMRSRAMRDHTWDARLRTMLAAAKKADVRVPTAAAA